MRSGMMAWSKGASSPRSEPRDVDDVRPGAVDLRAHLVENATEFLDLRLTRAVDERRAPAREGGRHHQVLGAGDGGDVEVDLAAAQAAPAAGPLGQDVPALEAYRAAHRLEALEMLVDGPRADRASAGERHPRAAEARDERPEHENARAHLLHQLVGRLRTDARPRRHVDDGRRHGHVAAEKAQERCGRLDVAERRHVPQPARAVGKECGAEDGQSRVLRAADPHRAAQRPAAPDENGVHVTWLLWLLWPLASAP